MNQTTTKTTFQKYAVYKDSGVEWLGKIPDHWKISRLRNVFSFSKGLTITKENLQEQGIYCVNYGEIHSKFGFEVKPEIHQLKCVSDEYLISNPNSLVRKGDFVFADTSEDIEGSGNFTYLNSNLITFAGYHTIIARLKTPINERFSAYVFDSQSFRNQIRSRVKGVKVYSITQSLLKMVSFWFPDEEEQTAIANFLDNKTAKIDRAIAQKEQLIALLKERKQIMIQDLVTGKRVWNKEKRAFVSLSQSGVEGKDSGVECLPAGEAGIGEIPEHWEVKRLKYIVKILKRIIGYEGPDVLSITQKGIKIKNISSGEGQLAMDYSKYQIINKGEFAMNHMDLLTGYVDISKFDGVISPEYRVFVPFIDEIEDEYLLGIFQVGYKSKIFYRYGQGVSQLGRWRLPAENFNEFSISIPPRSEQVAIMEHIEIQSTKIDQAIGLQQTQIVKLKEYKATLIDSVVTGKIKVY